MPNTKQTYISNYFKSALKFSKCKERSINKQTMSNISSSELDTLKRMKEIVNEGGLNSIKLPFALPHYKRDSDKNVSTMNLSGTLRKHSLTKTSNEGFEPCRKKTKKQLLKKSKEVEGKRMSQKKFLDEKPTKKNKGNSTENVTSPVRKKVSTFIGVHSPNKKVENRSDLILNTEGTSTHNLDETILVKSNEYISTNFISDKDIYKSPSKIAIISDTVLTGNERLSIDMITPTQKNVQINTNNTAKQDTDLNLKVPYKKEEDTNKEEWNPWVLNFVKNIFTYVASHNSLKKLLTCKESTTMNRFLKLPKNEYMFICIKLYLRIKTWYNVFKLRDSVKLKLCDREVMDMYTHLTAEGFVDNDYSAESIDSLLHHLLLSDIKDLCASFKLSLPPRASKGIMIEKLIQHCNKQSTLTFKKSIKDILLNRIKQKMGHCIRINTDFYKILHKVHVLYKFVTNDFQKVNDLYHFLSRIRDGTISLPQITINQDYEMFSSIACFSSFQQAYELKNEVVSAIENKSVVTLYDLCSLAYEELRLIVESNITNDKPPCIQQFTPGYQYAKALTTGLKHLTRQHPDKVTEWLQFLLEQPKYCKHLTGSWYNTLIMVQFRHLKQYEAATSNLIKALQTINLSKVDVTELNARAETIKKSQMHKVSQLQFGQISSLQPILIEDFPCIEIDAKALRSDVPGRKRNYCEKSEKGSEYLKVEELALRHYFKNGFINGLHCEGILLVSIFFILFWDIIYGDKVLYAFVSQIQYYPLDLMSKEFYENRREDIYKRLSEIECDWSLTELNQYVCTTWKKHSHEKSFINADVVVEPKQLFDILLCIERVKLRKIMEHLAKDFKTYHSGLPDLFLWNVNEKKCKFVEVKGENDRLSPKQKCWLDFLRSIDADIEVCHVHSIGSKRKSRTIKTEKDQVKKPK